MQVANMMPSGLPQQAEPPAPMSAPGAPPGGPVPIATKRELSQSKRAAQNRAAQRAFRQRKEGYIKKLEQQVRDFAEMETNYKALQSENYALREYVIHLQSRLLDAKGECPQPPPNVNLSHPHGPPPPQIGLPPATTPESSTSHASGPAAGTPLEAVAQAVANLGRNEHPAPDAPYTNKTFKSEASAEDSRTADAIHRQLQADGLPPAPM